MPTQTFFRLPEQKRERLIEAAWKEFSAVRFAEASINRIVQSALIPRGSFYQYFEDKEDVFFLLLGSLREEAFGLMTGALADAGGDPFRASLRLFDDVFQRDGSIRPSMKRVVGVLRLNQNLDMSQMVLGRMRSDEGIREIEKGINWTMFRQSDPDFLHNVAALLVFSFASAVRSILIDGATVPEERSKLSSRLDIIRRGSMKEEMAS